MRAAEQNPKDREAKPQGLTFPIKLRCTSVTDLLSEPGLEAGLARALGRAFARARSALPSPVAVGGGVALQAPYLTGRILGGAQASALLARIRRAIQAAARAQSLPLKTSPRRAYPETRPSREIAERFDSTRFDPQATTYHLPSYQGGQQPVPVKAKADTTQSDDGLQIAVGHEEDFWKATRSLLFTHVENESGLAERNEAIRILLQGIRRPRAQALIREALDRPYSGVRLEMIDALGKISHDRPIAWRLLFYGVERPGDLSGYGPLEVQLDKDADPLIAVLEAVIAGTDEPYRTNASKVVRRYLEGQFDPRNSARRRTYDRLRALAAKFGLYSSGPLGAGATRDRIEHAIDLLIDTIPAITDPLTPAAPRETAQTNDEHALDTLRPSLIALKGSFTSLAGDALVVLDTRLTAGLEMAFVLPDRIAVLQQAIRGIAKTLPKDDVPSDEIVALQRLRRRFLQAFASASVSDRALAEFNAAETTFADLRNAVADVKLERLAAEFRTATDAVYTGSSLPRQKSEPTFASMKELLGNYTQTFFDLLTPRAAGNVSWGPWAANLESVVQIETDLALYKILGAMFLQYAVALRYEQDAYAEDVGGDKYFREDIAYRSRTIRNSIVDLWNREDYSEYVRVAEPHRRYLEDIGSDIKREQKRDQDIRTAILLAATLVAGVAGVIVRAALIGTLLEAAGGASRLAIAVTLTEATAFTATQIGLEHAAFGKPVTLAGAAQAWVTNLAQFAAFGAVSRVLGPLGGSGRTWLSFIGRHAFGLTLQVDIAALSLLAQGRAFPKDVGNFLVETFGVYAIGATTAHIAGTIQNQAISARAAEINTKGNDILRRANEAVRTGTLDEPAFNRLKHDLLAWLHEVEVTHEFMRDSGVMTREEHDAALDVINQWTDGIAKAQFQAGRTYTGPLLLEAGKVPGLVKAGSAEIYRYDPQRPPARLAELARSYQRIASLVTTFEKGTLVVREPVSRQLVLMIGPGPVPAGLIAPPPPGAPPPHPLTFIESAAGGPLTPAGLAATTAILAGINRNAVTELQSRGDSGLAALSLLIKYQTTLRPWPIAAVRGLGTALELPRAITKANLERFFSRPSSEIADLFDDFNAIADMPGANLVFRQPATQRTIILVKLYRELLAGNFKLPPGMNESAQRGLLNMLATYGRQLAIDIIRELPVDRRLAEFIRNDPLATQLPSPPAAQQILDRHAADVIPGINLADPKHSPAEVRAQIENYASQHGGSFDKHIPARIETAISDYRATLRRVQEGTESDSRNLDGIREEFRALFLALDRGAEILSFSRMLGAAAGDSFQAEIDVGWHPLRGRVTVLHAPKDAKVQLDILARTASGIGIEEVTFAQLELPASLRALATATGPVSVDWSQLSDSTTHRKWKQILKNIALAEFGEELSRSWGGSPIPVRLVVRARSATANAQAALKNLGVDFEIINPQPSVPTQLPATPTSPPPSPPKQSQGTGLQIPPGLPKGGQGMAQSAQAYGSVVVGPSGAPAAAVVLISGQKALTPRQAYDFVLAKRGFEEAVPVHQHETVSNRIKVLEGTAKQTGSIAALRQRLTDKGLSPEAKAQLEKDLAGAQKELGHLRSALAISVPRGPGGPAGAGYNTYAVIQVIDRDGNLIAWGEGKYSGGPHAEEIAIDELRGKLTGRDVSAARIEVVGDRVVCPAVCRPAIQRFAAEIKATSADGYVYQRPRATGEGLASEKTTARTATQRSVQEKIEGVHGTVPLTEVHERIYP